jgi:hypothetical protein
MADSTVVAHTGANPHSGMEKVASRHSAINGSPEILAGEADAELLGMLDSSIH